MFKVYLIARNSFEEMVRQPLYVVIFYVMGLLITLSPLYTLFVFYETHRLLLEMGMTTIMLTGIMTVSFSASHTLTSEIHKKTILVLATKPVNRFQLLLGKYLGIVFCGFIMVLFHYILLVYVIRMGAIETSAFKIDWPVLVSLLFIFFGSNFYGFFQNYFSNKNFCSSAVYATIFFSLLSFFIIGIWDKEWHLSGYWMRFNPEFLKGVVLIFCSLLVISSISLSLSPFVSRNANLFITFCLFAVGLFSDQLVLSGSGEGTIFGLFLNVIPNFHVFQMSDAIIFDRIIPMSYMYSGVTYALMYLVGVFTIGYVFFDRKELA
ncbi:MAG: hypothetical protein COA79_12180 [Planctomycetota bacterium]|nr:MAG: hypothetical protein COA79_12180 [Planctomycetota bacterium]